MEKFINLTYHKLNIKIETSFTPFLEFVTTYFTNNLAANSQQSNICISFEKIKSGEFDKKIDEFINEHKCEKLSRRIWHNDNTAIISEVTHLPGLRLIFKIEKQKLFVYAFYEADRGIKKSIFEVIYQKKYLLKLNLTLKYYLILFPIFWYNEYFKNQYLLHASALKFADNTIIFPGLGGAGKSTLVLALMHDPRFSFISDNLILYDKSSVFSCYESIALDSKSLNLIGNAREVLHPLNIPMSHDRLYYHVKERQIESGDANTLIFIKFSTDNYIKPISSEKSFNKILSINIIAKEVQEYIIISSILNLVFNPNINNKKNESLKEFTHSLKCYELGMKYGMDPKTFIPMIEEIIENNKN